MLYSICDIIYVSVNIFWYQNWVLGKFIWYQAVFFGTLIRIWPSHWENNIGSGYIQNHYTEKSYYPEGFEVVYI